MNTSLLLLAFATTVVSAFCAILAFWRIGRVVAIPTDEQLRDLLRGEGDRVIQFGDGQSRGLREELGGTIRGFQDSTLKAFRELGDALAIRINEFGIHMDAGVKAVDERALAIGEKLNHDIAQMGEEAHRARDALRHVIEMKLDDAGVKHAATAKESRQEMVANFQHLGSVVTDTLGQLSAQQKERLDKRRSRAKQTYGDPGTGAGGLEAKR